MLPQRQSCDRCRQQKVRCLKNTELQATIGGGSDHYAPCERCAKVDVPCVYSLRPKNRRASHHLRREGNNGNARTIQFTQDMAAGMHSRNDILGPVLGDLTIPLLDMADTTMSGFDSIDRYSWSNNNSNNDNNNNSNPNFSSIPLAPTAIPSDDATCGIDCDVRSLEGLGDNSALSRDEGKGTIDILTNQLMALSTKATRATRQLDHAGSGSSTPLTVNSPVVNEAFQVANTLVRIINRIPLVNNSTSTSTFSQSLPHDDENDLQQTTTDYGLVFQALASHQHVLALFKAICDSIQQSLESMVPGSEQQQQALHGDESSSAQFVMVLQLIIHLINRVGWSLQMGTRNSISSEVVDDITLLHSPSKLTFGLEGGGGGVGGEESGGSQYIIDLALDILTTLPNEHLKLRQVIQGLQTRMEENLYKYS